MGAWYARLEMVPPVYLEDFFKFWQMGAWNVNVSVHWDSSMGYMNVPYVCSLHLQVINFTT